MRKTIAENEQFNFQEGDISENVQENSNQGDLQNSRTLFEDSSTPKFNSKILSNKDMNVKKHNTSKNRQIEHAQKFQAVKKQKIKEMKIQLQNKAMQECTFKPMTNRNSSTRNLKQFLQSQQNHTNKIHQKQMTIRRKMQQQSLKNATFSPAINKSQSKIDKPKEIVHQRLYKLKDKVKNSGDGKQNLHTPKITQRSTNLHRNRPIDQLLYQDAQRRMEKQNEYPQQQAKAKSKDYKKDKYAAQKFLKEYYNVFEKNKFKEYQQLTYNEFNQILKDLGYIKYSSEVSNRLALQEKNLIKQAYKFISKYKLNSYNICTFLLAVGGLYQICLVDDVLPEQSDKSRLILSQSEGKKIHHQFDLLFRNKLSGEYSKKVIKEEENTFTPTINHDSAIRAERYRDKMIDRVNQIFQKNQVNITLPQNGVLTHQDLLVIHSIGKNLEKEKLRQMNSIKHDPECTFQPNTARSQDQKSKISYKSGIQKSNQLYQYAKIKKENQKSKQSAINNEKQGESKKESHPHIPPLPTNKKSYHGLSTQEEGCRSFRDIPDVDKAVARMFQGRKMRTNKNQFLARGQKYTNNPISKSKSKTKLTNKIQIDGKHTKSQMISSEPFLVVDINLDEQLNHLYFYDGDQHRVKQIVGKFCKDNNIDDKSQRELVIMVEKEISKVLEQSESN